MNINDIIWGSGAFDVSSIEKYQAAEYPAHRIALPQILCPCCNGIVHIFEGIGSDCECSIHIEKYKIGEKK